MRLFGCHVTILNTLDHLGKFDGKADEGFFVIYSLNSKAFRVFNSRKRIVEENLHIRFSESTPNVVGSRPDWLFDIDVLTRTMNYEPIAAGTQSNGFADPKSSHYDGFKPSSDDDKMVYKDLSKGSKSKDQEKQDNVNSTNNVNTVSSTVNAAGINELPFDPNMPALEDIYTFDFLNKDEDDGEIADMNNLKTTIQVLKRSARTRPLVSKDSTFDLAAYTGSDYAGASLDKKPTIGAYGLLPKQEPSTGKHKYVPSANSSARVTQQLSSGNTFALTVAKYSSSRIFITSSRNALEHLVWSSSYKGSLQSALMLTLTWSSSI
uniref:Retrovirus-related Pol polyprotein from transposon TNT 1-94 n=1 Tax=Tanacetum cinerariifolium TaxID=118510 RepID=A0A6L2MSM0_TANCI|nr:retrovirus-related Pol polyprotein from transposon TNT 1-94 [Tanacetum cinerariifolium]